MAISEEGRGEGGAAEDHTERFKLWSNNGVFVLGIVVSQMFIISFKINRRPVMIVGPELRIMMSLALKSSLEQKGRALSSLRRTGSLEHT